MDFKVEVSLWNQVGLDGRQQPPMDTGSTTNFRDKLALDTPPQQPSLPPEQAALVQSPSSMLHAQLPSVQVSIDAYQRLAARSPSTVGAEAVHGHGEADLVELYELGALAGHHLSQMPEQFASQTRAAVTPGLLTTNAAVKAPGSAVPSEQPTTVTYAVEGHQPVELHSEQRPHEVPASSSATRRLEMYLTNQWPERRMQVIAHGADEAELVIRDYHLDADEQEALVADLRRHLAARPNAFTQIRLNGQSIWNHPLAANQE
jgi:hypothetical protein